MIKIYDFIDENNPNPMIGRPREFAWPCDMFHVMMPRIGENYNDGLNAFERCILRLLRTGFYPPEDLAEEICLPNDLVVLILSRLVDKGKIDDTYKLLNPEHEITDKVKFKYDTYVVFRECIGGSILPFMTDATTLRSEEIIAPFAIKKKTGKEIKLSSLNLYRKNFNNLSVKDVYTAWRTMRRRIGKSLNLPQGIISVSSSREKCLLRARMVIQKSGDWRVLNPFGDGWSIELESSYKILLEVDEKVESEFQKWQELNKSSVRTSYERENPLFQLNSDEIIKRYIQLFNALKRKDVYSAIEWALFYALQQVDSQNVVQILKIDTRENNEKRLIEAWESLVAYSNTGTAKKKITNNMFVPTIGKLQSFQDGKQAEMNVVLPIALLVAFENPHFTFNKLITKYPNYLSIIEELKTRRDKKLHGKIKWEEIYGENDYTFMQDIVKILLPSIILSESQEKETVIEDEYADIRLNARIALQDIFGISKLERMDSLLRENLLQAEIFLESHQDINKDKFDTLHCVNCLYAATQCAFRMHLDGDFPNDYSIAGIEKKCVNVGWNNFPVGLRTVREEMLKKTLDGDDQTLGAIVLAWLLKTNESILRNVVVILPAFLSDIDLLIKLRGHGNQTLMMSYLELDEVCKKTYKLINTVAEV